MVHEVHENRRATYRVKPTESTPVGIKIEIGGATTAAARVVDVTINGAAAMFPIDALPGMEAGDSVRLWVELPGLESAIAIEATLVADAVTGAGEYQCNFRFDRSEDLNQLSEELYSLMNRRYCRRLGRDELTNGVGIALEFPPQFGEPIRYHVGLKDLSLTGAGILANGDLADTEFVKLFITTPNQPEPLILDARIRYRSSGDEIARYGLKIDIRDSEDYALYAEELTNSMTVAA